MPENNENIMISEAENETKAAEQTPDAAKKSGEGIGKYARLVVSLTAICVVVALLLSVVNMLTKDVIATNESEEKKATVFSIFTEADDLRFVRTDEKTGADVYEVLTDGSVCGYCVNVLSGGFGGDINMMVGITPDHSVKAVKIISLSETPGVGSKTNSDSFLSQFEGKSGTLAVGEGVDAISGATVSSRAVTNGVNMALSVINADVPADN